MCDVVWFRCEAAVLVGFLLRFDFQNHFNYSANTLFNIMCAENHRVRALKKKKQFMCAVKSSFWLHPPQGNVFFKISSTCVFIHPLSMHLQWKLHLISNVKILVIWSEILYSCVPNFIQMLPGLWEKGFGVCRNGRHAPNLKLDSCFIVLSNFGQSLF